MWMVNPKGMCRRHLLGEHAECHMFAGHLKRKRKINNYIAYNLLEPLSLKNRHDSLAKEMLKRGYKHKSPLPEYDLSYLPKEHQNYQVDKVDSAKELHRRCDQCRKRTA